MINFRILGKNPVRWFFGSLRRSGLRQTLVIIWSVIVDLWFDFRYGTDTFRRVPQGQIETDSENIVHSANYGASKAVPFMRLMRRLKLPHDAVFLDLGSGKGRAVMLAARYGFRKVIGVEFSGALCEKARDNLQRFLRKCPCRAQIEIIESDVTKHNLRDDETVFFMFDPFDGPVLAQVLHNIRASMERQPRTVWLIYSVPREQEIINQVGVFTQVQRHIVLGGEFLVYSNEPYSTVAST